MGISIRIAEEKDAAAMLAIYAPLVANTTITFEYEIPSINDFAARILQYLKDYPWLVCEHGTTLIAYAYAGKHRERKAYQWSAESSIYVGESFRGNGYGKKLYEVLFRLLKEQGLINVYAGITQPNERSVYFHRSCGFTEVGIYKNVGYKLSGWHDVLWMHKALSEYPLRPVSPIPFSDFRTSNKCVDILRFAAENREFP